MANWDIKFPGCFPFVVRQPLLHLEGVLDGLREFLQPGKNILKGTSKNYGGIYSALII